MTTSLSARSSLLAVLSTFSMEDIMSLFDDFSPVGKIVTGIGIIAAAPLAVAAAVPVIATVGAVAVTAGASTAAVVGAGATAAAATGTAVKAVGGKAVASGVKDLVD